MEDKTSKMAIGKRIKALREKNKEKQKNLALLLETTQNSISKVENGTSGLTIDNLIKIAEHYRVSLDYLCKGEGGTDILDTLKKYVNFSYSSISGMAEDDNSHLIPKFSINKFFYRYLSQVAQANSTSEMPENIKQLWIAQAEKEFNDTIINDMYSDCYLFIPLNETVLQEQRNIIKEIEKHIAE